MNDAKRGGGYICQLSHLTRSPIALGGYRPLRPTLLFFDGSIMNIDVQVARRKTGHFVYTFHVAPFCSPICKRNLPPHPCCRFLYI
jgi:hypothetical protein